MSGPYFDKQGWPPFVYQGVTYGLTHLDEYQIEVLDSAKVKRRISVTFSDHCLTRNPEPGDDPALLYAYSSRNPGQFCIERYQHSLNLAGYIAQTVTRNVWNLG
jgi:hypothetical protein